MDRRTGDLQALALTGGLTVLGGVALWRLGREYERAWMRTYDGPLLGEQLDGASPQLAHPAQPSEEIPGLDQHRRWVARHHPRGRPGAARMS
jgi:hypothetical protein